MIRRSLIVLCVAAAVATLFAGAMSHYGAFMFAYSLSPRHIAIVHFFDTRIRFFWIHSQTPLVQAELVDRGGHIAIGVVDPYTVEPGTSFWANYIFIHSRVKLAQFADPWYGTIPFLCRGPLPCGHARYTRLPHWVVAVLLLLPTMRFFVSRFRRRWRERHGLCTNCAYDLRGLPEPRCPECGTPVQRASEAHV